LSPWRKTDASGWSARQQHSSARKRRESSEC